MCLARPRLVPGPSLWRPGCSPYHTRRPTDKRRPRPPTHPDFFLRQSRVSWRRRPHDRFPHPALSRSAKGLATTESPARRPADHCSAIKAPIGRPDDRYRVKGGARTTAAASRRAPRSLVLRLAHASALRSSGRLGRRRVRSSQGARPPVDALATPSSPKSDSRLPAAVLWKRSSARDLPVVQSSRSRGRRGALLP